MAGLALVAGAEARFEPGLNLMTGETGSGKSMIVDALGLCLGDRASSEQVRHGAGRARVEAEFDGQVLAREIGRRSQAYADGQPVTVEELRARGRRLVQIHGQHAQQALLDPETQTLSLDSFAGGLRAREEVGLAHQAFTAALGRLRELERLEARGRREEEYLRWQLQELRAADIRPGEDQELAAERALVKHAARLGELTGEALEALRSERELPLAVSRAREAVQLDPRLEPVAARLEAVEQELGDLKAELRGYGDRLEADPARLEALESRAALLEGIKRKFGGSLEAAIQERERIERQLGQAADLETALPAAAEAVEAARARLEEATAELSAIRWDGAQRLSGVVAQELAGLRLEGARFEVRLTARGELGADGAEVAEMMFSANPGEPLAGLAVVASGGEMARVMLAVKTATAEADRVPTLVFDEVDQGIGGETALEVGVRLKRLGSARQVLVVTHLAQIACFADHHLLIEKSPGPEGRNLVSVRELRTEGERAQELARMMSGRVTDKALARAHELIGEARALGAVRPA